MQDITSKIFTSSQEQRAGGFNSYTREKLLMERLENLLRETDAARRLAVIVITGNSRVVQREYGDFRTARSLVQDYSYTHTMKLYVVRRYNAIVIQLGALLKPERSPR